MASPPTSIDERTARDERAAPSPHVDTARHTAGIARGERAAFAAFYDAWFERAVALARRTLRTDEDGALDVVQDVMMRVARSMPVLRDERAVEAWMARAVFTVSIDRVRADARRARHERSSGDGEHPAAPDALTQAELGEQLAWLRRQLDALPDGDRHAVLLRFSGDDSLDAVGRALGMTGNAAHGRIRRAIARLRRKATEVFGDGST